MAWAGWLGCGEESLGVQPHFLCLLSAAGIAVCGGDPAWR